LQFFITSNEVYKHEKEKYITLKFKHPNFRISRDLSDICIENMTRKLTSMNNSTKAVWIRFFLGLAVMFVA
jgi:hypothetical protein